MAKLNRLTAKIFGETASTTNTPKEIGQFGSAKAGTYNATGDVAAIQSLPAWSNGWIDAVTPTDQFPPLPEMTGVHKVLSYQNAYLLQQGIPEWDSATTYYINNFCTKNGKIYISLTNENLNNDPETDTVNWKAFVSGGFGHSLFDIVYKDHALVYEESEGFALLGSYVYKTAVAGSRYGYPDFYAKCLEEYQDVNNTTETVSGITVTVNSNGHKFYDISDKSAIDAIYNNTGEAWYYGIDTTNERIVIPRSTRFKNAQSASEVGGYQEAGLPNIEGGAGSIKTEGSAPTISGALIATRRSGSTYYSTTNPYASATLLFDASLSNPIYGNSDTVEYSSTKLIPYMVVGNTPEVSAVTDVTEVTTSENDTIPLFTAQYFDFTPNSPSWLVSGGQANSGDIYTTCYNELVNILNGETKYGTLKVIDVADMQTGVDYSEYWKVNQTEEYFICPLIAGLYPENRILVDKKEATDADPEWYNLYSDGWLEQGGIVSSSFGNNVRVTVNLLKPYINTAYNINLTGNRSGTTGECVPVIYGTPTTSSFEYMNDGDYDELGFRWKTCGYTTIPDMSDYSGNVNLYFKVANAVQNLELLDVGEVMEAVADKISRQDCVSYITETYQNSTSGYNVYSNGYCEQWGRLASSGTGSYVSGTITFLKPFIDTNFNIYIMSSGGTGGAYAALINGRTNSSVDYSHVLSRDGADWKASGYIN